MHRNLKDKIMIPSEFFEKCFNKSVVHSAMNLWLAGDLPVDAQYKEPLNIWDAAYLLYLMASAKPGCVNDRVAELNNSLKADGLAPGWHGVNDNREMLAFRILGAISQIIADDLGEDAKLEDLVRLHIAPGAIRTLYASEFGAAGLGNLGDNDDEIITLPGAWLRTFVSEFVK